MEPKIRNFRAIEKFIQNNPQEALTITGQWQMFLKEMGPTNPELFIISRSEDWYRWVDQHSELDIDADLWAAKEISLALPIVRATHPQGVPQAQYHPGGGGIGMLGGLSALPLALLAKDRPEIIQEDKAYKKIEKELVTRWVETNPGKTFDSKEGLDWLYGRIDGEKGQSLAEEAENLFRERFPKKAKHYDRRKKKTYKDPNFDPAARRLRATIEAHAERRYSVLNEDEKENWSEILKKIRENEYDKFANQFTEKAKAYTKYDENLEKALLRRELTQVKGKEVKFTEKVHRPPRTITPKQAAEQLAKVTPQPSVTPSGLKIPTPTLPAAEGPPLPPGQMPIRIPSPAMLRAAAPLRLAGLAGRAAVGAVAPLIANPVTLTVLLLFILGLFLILFGTGFTGAPSPGGGPGPVTSITPLPTGTKITPPPPPSNLAQQIQTEFGITMNGFDQQHLQWAWEKFWDISGTRFNSLVRGTTITASSSSQQTGCRSVNLQYLPEELFKVILIHELGHVIRNCNSHSATKYDEHMIARGQEGGVTRYAQTACTYTRPGEWERSSEDYAEMITYYLNPNAGEQTARCAGTGPNPYSGGRHPLHFNVAREILGTY